MSAKIRDMSDIKQFPISGDIIILDTSVVIGLTKQSRNCSSDYDICSTFLRNALQNNNILGITAKTYDEIQYIAEAKSFPKQKWKVDFPSNIATTEQIVEDIYESLKGLANFYPDLIGGNITPVDLNSEVERNRKHHSLRIGDAQILTQAYSEGCYNICTLDKDWINVKDPKITILTQQKYIKNNTSNTDIEGNISKTLF